MNQFIINLWNVLKDAAEQNRLDDAAHNFIEELIESDYANDIVFNRLKDEDKYLKRAIIDIVGEDEDEEEIDEAY